MDDPMGSAATVVARTPHLNDHAVTETITMHTVGKVCTLVRAAASRAGVATRDIDDLLIAVSELVTNVIRHAGGTGSITVRSMSAGLFAEISDNGPGLPETLAIERPGIRQGQGLWLARLLCDDLQVVSGHDGVTVRIFTPRQATS
jgi:anti-sigma regulatory factor (Ser/Thr protein kinase)